MQPMAVEILPGRRTDPNLLPSVRPSGFTDEMDRCVTWRPDRSFIEERIRIYNPTTFVRPLFLELHRGSEHPGFRFVYPMTLGCDHAGEKFFNWPIDQGKT
jgi:hypothetical protein